MRLYSADITGSLIVEGPVVDFTNTSAISGSIFSGSFVGDGSGLTGTDSGSWDGVYSGSAEITGSLRITGSLDTTGDAVFGGSVSGSNLSGTNTGDQTNITGNAGTATLAAGATTLTGNLSMGGNDVIGQAGALGSLVITGGTAVNLGTNINLYDSASASSGDFLIRANTTNSLFYDSSNILWNFFANKISTTGTLASGAATITGGISINGGTDVLDAYVESTFTPAFADAASGGNEASVASANGRKVIIGALVTVWIEIVNINTTGMTGGNTAYVTGLGTTMINSTMDLAVGSCVLDRVSFSGYVVPICAANTSYLTFDEIITGAANAPIKVSDFTSGTADFYATISYEAA